jgi:hypothetical protein
VHWYAQEILKLNQFEIDEFIRVITAMDRFHVSATNRRLAKQSK